MGAVRCSVEETTLSGEYKDDVPSVQVTCSRCDHTTESFGTSTASIRRCLVMLKEECPLNQSNWYFTDEDN